MGFLKKVTTLLLALAFTSQWCCCLWGFHDTAAIENSEYTVVNHGCCSTDVGDEETSSKPVPECAHVGIDEDRHFSDTSGLQVSSPHLVELPFRVLTIVTLSAPENHCCPPSRKDSRPNIPLENDTESALCVMLV